MRTDSLLNGGLIGFGLGFILASIALYIVVSKVLPDYAVTWHFRGIAAVGGVGLLAGIGLEVFQRIRMKNKSDDG